MHNTIAMFTLGFDFGKPLEDQDLGESWNQHFQNVCDHKPKPGSMCCSFDVSY